MNSVNLLKDMELFVRVVRRGTLAAAGRELQMTPSSVTMRINNLEKHYKVKLLIRTTRSVNLTDEGLEFYKDCLKTLDEINNIETKLKSDHKVISGPLRITAPSDLGRQHIAPVIHNFVGEHPEVQPFLNLSDTVIDINDIDIAIRYGSPEDTLLITKKIGIGKRVLCASPEYLQNYGTPQSFEELSEHLCLPIMQISTRMARWYFDTPQGERSMLINPSRSCDDGAQIRQWAIEGAGIALKSIWEVANDINTGRLVTILDKYHPDYQSKKTIFGSDLYIVYQNREYLPRRNLKFIQYLSKYFKELEENTNLNMLNNIIMKQPKTNNVIL